MIKCIIIDDEKLAREILSILILKSESGLAVTNPILYFT